MLKINAWITTYGQGGTPFHRVSISFGNWGKIGETFGTLGDAKSNAEMLAKMLGIQLVWKEEPCETVIKRTLLP
jgi:hypothetical protein